MGLSQEAGNYLLSRGYSIDLIRKEEIQSIQKGQFMRGGVNGFVDVPSLLMPIRTMSGRIAAWHTAGIGIKDYRTFYDPNHRYLAVFYASKEDMDLMWTTGETVVAEGIFDRVAIKRAFPERSVLARLTKGMSPQMKVMLERVCKRVWLAFDNDDPGNKAADKAEKRMNLDTVRLLNPYKDPALFLQKRGLAVTVKHYNRQFSAFDL